MWSLVPLGGKGARNKRLGLASLFVVPMRQAQEGFGRDARPDIELSIHIYPYFAPNPYYGHRLDIDYVGETVAWFFRLHWPLEKVLRLAEDVVGKQGSTFAHQEAAPLIGFYADPHRDLRSSTRVRREIEAAAPAAPPPSSSPNWAASPASRRWQAPSQQCCGHPTARRTTD